MNIQIHQLRFANILLHFPISPLTSNAEARLWPDIFAFTKKEGNTCWWDSLHDLQRRRGSTCSLTAWLTFILNLNIHFGFPGMWGSDTLRRGPAIPRHSRIRSQMTRHRESSSRGDKAADIWFIQVSQFEHNNNSLHFTDAYTFDIDNVVKQYI